MDSIFADQDWTRTEKFYSPFISGILIKGSVCHSNGLAFHDGLRDFWFEVLTD